MAEGRHSNIQMRQLKKELRFCFERDVLLLDRDEEAAALGIESRAVLAAGSGDHE